MLNLIRREWRLLLFGFLMTFWSAPGQTFLISLFSGEIRAELDFGASEFAGIYSLATLMSAGIMIWSGSLADRIDLKKLALASVLGLALGCAMMSIANGIATLLISLLLLRQFGQGLMFIISATAMVRYLDADKGKATALASIGYASAEAIMPSLLVVAIFWLGWRGSWQLIAALLLAFMLPAIIFLLRDHHQRHGQYLRLLTMEPTTTQHATQRRHWTRSEVIRDKYFYLFIPGLLSQPLMFTGFIFHQVHLVESKDWPLLGWAALFSLYALVSVITKLLCGFCIDRFGAIRLVPLVALPMGLGLVVLAFSTSLLGAAIFLVLTGITVGAQSTATAPFWSEMYGNRHLGAIKALGAAAMVFCTAISPLIIGWQIDLGASIDSLAVAAGVYILLTSGLAYYAYRQRSAIRHQSAY